MNTPSAIRRPVAGPAAFALAGALVLATLAGFILLPAGTELPIHWGITGEPDRYAAREIALLVPVAMALFVWALSFGLRRFMAADAFEAGRHALRAVLVALTGLALLIQMATILAGLGQPVDIARLISLGVAVMLLLLGNAIPKSQPNNYAGLRIPSTLGDARNWQFTHRLVGRLYMAAGMLLAVLALLELPSVVLLLCLFGAVLLPLGAGVAYSLALARAARRS